MSVSDIDNFKKIRIEYYRYRIRRGRAYILLKKENGGDYSMPSHYVTAEERVRVCGMMHYDIEDDGDLVINDLRCDDWHLKMKGLEWVLLNEITTIQIRKKDSIAFAKMALKTFLRHVRTEEASLRRKIESLFESVMMQEAKNSYIEEIQHVIDGKPIIGYCDVYITRPDMELLKEEIKTLAHFHIRKIERIDNWDYLDSVYSYEPIDWEAFGAKIHPCGNISGELIQDVIREDKP